MTGEDCLVQALVEMYGLSKTEARTAVNTKNTKRIIEALAVNGGLLEKVALENLKARETEFERQRAAFELEKSRFYQTEIWNERAKIEAEKREHREEIEQLKGLKELEANLLTIDDPEKKDRLRLSEIFRRYAYANVETSQNKSVYIAGMASILGGTPIWGVDPQTEAKTETEQKKAMRRI